MAAVVNGNRVLRWDGKEKRLDQLEEERGQLAPEEIVDLLEDGGVADGGSLLAVLVNGRVRRLDALMRKTTDADSEERPSPVLTEGHKVIEAANFDWEGRHYVCLTAANVGGRRERSVLTLRLREGQRNSEIVATPVKGGANAGKNGRPLTVCLGQGHLPPSLLYVDAEGVLLLAPLVVDGQASAISGLPKGVDLSASKRVMAAALSSAPLALLAVRSEKGATLFLLHLIFCTVLDSFEVEGQLAALSALEGQFFLAVEQSGGRVQVLTTSASAAPKRLNDMIGFCETSKGKNQKRAFPHDRASAAIKKSTSRGDISSLVSIIWEEKDLPELVVLAMVEHLLKAPAERFASESQRENLLAACLEMAVTESLMLPYLSRLSLDVTVQLVDYLDKAMRLEAFRTWPQERDGNARLEALVQWTSMTLCARYGDLILMRDSRVEECLQRLKETAEALDDSATLLSSSVAPLLRLVESGYTSPRSRAGGADSEYCIEIVHM